MNIFYLHHDPQLAARFQHNKHIVKMCLETAQILCTVQVRYGNEAPYRPTHPNHPSVLWAGENKNNYLWLVRHGLELCAEYRRRYGKQHACANVIEEVQFPPGAMPDLPFTQPTQAMPDEFKVPGDSVLAYRKYYLARKVDQSTWTRRDVPPFVQEFLMAKKQKAAEAAPQETGAEEQAGTAPQPAQSDASTAPETAAETQAAAPAQAPRTRGPRGVPETAVLTVLAETNPKRANSKAAAVFALYTTGITIGELLDTAAKTEGVDANYVTPCLVYDAKHGFISIEGYDPGEIVQLKPRAPAKPKEAKAPKEKKAKAEQTAEQAASKAEAAAEAAAEMLD